ncbi:MAG TPA: ABC-type transport auxiliary lipoprotein family protein [Steroidobacteraceae bacterium]|nr:ABC-type transport auxiliary lipoprotein family protein [Steroidobacteraceae bacterium]
MKPMTLVLACVVAGLGGCGGFFESTIPPAQAYVLRLPPRPAQTGVTKVAGTLRVQRPVAGPGLDGDRIVLLRSDRRFDFYAATRWAAPAPDLVADVLVDQLRGASLFSSVLDDTAPYAPRYNLRCGLNRFEADYTGGGQAPTIEVVLDCTFGRYRDRTLLANFTARGSAPASDDRVGAVVAAFEAATAKAVAELERKVADALANETPPEAPAIR